MSRIIHCTYLKQDAAGLERAPWPGTLGQKIFNEISKDAWNKWISHQTTLINENRLNLIDPNARTFLAAEMEKFLFGEGSAAPAGFKPPDTDK